MSRKEEILGLLCDQHLTQKEISQRLKISEPRVSFLVASLRESGLITRGKFPQKKEGGVLKSGYKITTPTMTKSHPIRLHGQILAVKILNGSQKYESLLKAGLYELQGHQIQLFPDKLILHSIEGLEFVASTAREAHKESLAYWHDLIGQLEKELNLLLLKGKNTRLCFLREHYADIGNELAKEAISKKEKIAFRAPEDGKTYLTADLSTGEPELETLHPKTALPDMEAFKPFFDDMRTAAQGVTFSSFKAVLNERLAPLEKAVYGLEQEQPQGKPDYIG